MKSINLGRIFTALVILFAIGNSSSAQDTSLEKQPRHRTYRFIDLGTLGGPVSYESGEGNQILSNAGVIASAADTSVPDPNAPDFCFNLDCFVAHAIRWKNGTLTDLGIPGNNSSAAFAINAQGGSAGLSQNGLIDPLTGMPEWRAAFWQSDVIHELGTLGGDESIASAITNSGQVIGLSTIDETPDPFAFFGAPTHPFIWKDGEMVDLGTLGGPDAFLTGSCGNPELIVGGSLTNNVPNATTQFPTQDPFVWVNGRMIDLGTLGGTFGSAQCGNKRGQIIGQSDLAGDLTSHPFLWEKGVIRDLGTLGGDNGIPIWINDAGDVVGEADLPGSQTRHAFLWRKGVMTDLGTLDGNSHATAVNSKGQVVGYFSVSGRTEPPFRHPFIWEKDGPMVDLNTLIPANSGLELVAADNINDRGEIVGVGVPARCFPDFCGHLFLLIPCTSDDSEGCQDNGESPNAAVQNDPEPIAVRSASTQARPTPKERVASWRAQMASRYHIASRRTSTE
jgi:probable HAF family extracellular repeat protein